VRSQAHRHTALVCCERFVDLVDDTRSKAPPPLGPADAHQKKGAAQIKNDACGFEYGGL